MARLGLGGMVLIVVILLAGYSVYHTQQLAEQRESILATMLVEECTYDDPLLCPQAEGNVQLPSPLAVAILLLALLLGGYLWRTEQTHQRILTGLDKSVDVSSSERKELLFSILTEDERGVVKAVIEQPGITQATLRLRVDMSKSKLSATLKELEKREVLKREISGKTNMIHLKREL